MRFRRIEKEGPGAANVGLDQQHMQGKEDDVSTSESKTYIGSNTKKKVDMNKIKNTKIGDDIHYYVNGVEGRGIVVKMGSQYLDLFQQDGNVKTVNINDTFFVKDILINKQWDDMDDAEKYESLQKIHAPTPRFIVKSWSALPEEIKDLLKKDSLIKIEDNDDSNTQVTVLDEWNNETHPDKNGKTEGIRTTKAEGHTYEEGETQDSETQDHARTGSAQNIQYKRKEVEYDKQGRAYRKIYEETGKERRYEDPDTGKEDVSEHSYRHDREQDVAARRKKDPNYKAEQHERHPDYWNKDKNPYWNSRIADINAPGKFREPDKQDGTKGNRAKPHRDDKDPSGKYDSAYIHSDHKPHPETKLRNRRENQILSQGFDKNSPEFKAAHDANEKEYEKYKEKRKLQKTPEGKKRAEGLANIRAKRAEEDRQEKEQWEKNMTAINSPKPATQAPKKEETRTPAPKKETSTPIEDDDSWMNPMKSNDARKAYSIWLERRKAYKGEQ